MRTVRISLRIFKDSQKTYTLHRLRFISSFMTLNLQSYLKQGQMRALSRLAKFNTFNVKAFQAPKQVLPPRAPLATVEYTIPGGAREKHILYNQPSYKMLKDPIQDSEVIFTVTPEVLSFININSSQTRATVRFSSLKPWCTLQLLFQDAKPKQNLTLSLQQSRDPL